MNIRVGITCSHDSEKDMNETILDLIEESSYDRFKCFQLFQEGRKSFFAPRMRLNEKLLKQINNKDLSFHLHAPCVRYVTNEDETTTLKTEKYLLDTCRVIKRYPMDIVIHSGSRTDRNRGHIHISETFNRIKGELYGWTDRRKPVILLENSSGYSSTSRKTFCEVDEFRQVFEQIDTSALFGICLDTCHAFSAGISRWDNYNKTQDLLQEINDISKIGCVHLNDSDTDFNLKKDSHRLIGYGKIWNEDKIEGLYSISNFCIDNEIDMISEANHKKDSRDLETRSLKALCLDMKDYRATS